jgi:hypothetical protein
LLYRLGIVARHDDRFPIALGQRNEKSRNGGGIFSVQVSCRLIGQDQRGVIRQGERDGHALLLPTA